MRVRVLRHRDAEAPFGSQRVKSVAGEMQVFAPLLLVDDRGGLVVAELETDEEIRTVLEAWTTDDGTLPAR